MYPFDASEYYNKHEKITDSSASLDRAMLHNAHHEDDLPIRELQSIVF